MKMTNVVKGLSKSMTVLTGKTGLRLKKYSPEILLVVGIGGVITSTVLACRATLKVDDVMAEHHEKVDKVNGVWQEVQDGSRPAEQYTETDHKKDLTVIYAQTAVNFVKVYGPAVTLGVASIGCILGGHNIMKKRNVALMAAYKAVEEGFSAYRQRVVEEYGEEKDYMLKNGLKAQTVTETVTDADGKTSKVKKTVLSSDGDTNGLSVYARFFDESSPNWSKEQMYNQMFLKTQQNYFNDLLKIRGHVFLNEVYDNLGIPRTKAGAIVGWVIGEGDNYIDFGIFDKNSDKARDFINGYERSILLDFNVDGVIYDLI